MTSTGYTVLFSGIVVHQITVQVQISQGLPSFSIVGLPDKAVMEAKERVRAALNFLNIPLPAKRIIVNLSPAHMHKAGNHYDLPIAIVLLHAMGFIRKVNLDDYIIIGELGLDGSIYPVKGVLPAAIWCDHNNKILICPQDNNKEATLIGSGKEKILANNLQQLLESWDKCIYSNCNTPPCLPEEDLSIPPVFGQLMAKRALTIALAGKHHLLLIGPPGSGKSLLARTAPFIAGKLGYKESLEVSSIHSLAGILQKDSIVSYPPLRSPHHSASLASIIGGGPNCTPGDVSLAHHGILLLDELAEFPMVIIDALRQPMQDGIITLGRAKGTMVWNTKFQFIGTMNACKCGYYSSSYKKCSCSIKDVRNYLAKISGPIKQRISLCAHMDVQQDFFLHTNENGTQWAYQARELVNNAKEFGKDFSNDPMTIFDGLDDHCKTLINDMMRKKNFATREIYNILSVARTIANLDASRVIKQKHILESSSFSCIINKVFDV